MSLALDSARLTIDEGLASALAAPVGTGSLRALMIARAMPGDWLVGAGVEAHHRFRDKLAGYAKGYAGTGSGGYEAGAVAGLEWRW